MFGKRLQRREDARALAWQAIEDSVANVVRAAVEKHLEAAGEKGSELYKRHECLKAAYAAVMTENNAERGSLAYARRGKELERNNV